jgi:hypothetical protein
MFGLVAPFGLSSFEVVCRPSMAGRITATMHRRKIMLSPAMYHLWIHAEDRYEAEHLMKNITVQTIGQFQKQEAMEVAHVS